MMNMGAFMMDPVGTVVEANKSQWAALGACGSADDASGKAALHQPEARELIARKLIANHEKVLRDCTNSAPLTQHELKRAPQYEAQHADEVLMASAQRLLGNSAARVRVQLTPSPEAAETRRTVFEYFRGRIQSDPSQKPGRDPDMTPAAAAAWLAVLSEIAEA